MKLPPFQQHAVSMKPILGSSAAPCNKLNGRSIWDKLWFAGVYQILGKGMDWLTFWMSNHILATIFIHQTIPWVQFGDNFHMPKPHPGICVEGMIWLVHQIRSIRTFLHLFTSPRIGWCFLLVVFVLICRLVKTWEVSGLQYQHLVPPCR